MRPGVTLFELVTVVAIMGILAVIALPRFAAATTRRHLDAATQRIVADLRNAQQHALATSGNVWVAFNASTETYTVNAPSPLGNAASYSVRLLDAPAFATITSTSLSSSRVVFDGNGLVALGGDVVIAAGPFKRTITFTTGKMAFDPGSIVLGP